MSRLVKSISRISHDSMTLSRALWAARNKTSSSGFTMMTTLKPVLLDQARQSNRVATSLLRIEKGYGWLKYLGIRGCIQQYIRILSSPFSSGGSLSDSSAPLDVHNNGAINTFSKTTIAFMITTSMKQKLQETMGYSMDQIKKMTPLQASLVLNHQVPPADFGEQLPLLEKEYEQEQEEWRKQENQRLKLELECQGRQQEQENQSLDVPVDNGQLPPKDTVIDTSSSFSPEQLASAIGVKSGFEDTWYEVVEVKPDGDSVRQGLYPNTAEAELGLETRELIRNRQIEKDRKRHGENHPQVYSTFEIREVSRSELMEEQA
jgi:hypothetical protein